MMWNLFGPRNSLILLFDHLTDENYDDFIGQIEEIGRYYRFCRLSEIARIGKATRKLGQAAVCFRSARKSFFLRGARLLREKDIPVTLFLRPDCVGLNRLPLDEEWAAYGESADEMKRLAWEEPLEARTRLDNLRVKKGPPPLNEMDPTAFFGTWGNIVDIHASLIEVGLYVHERPSARGELAESAEFIRRQTKFPLQIAFTPFYESDTAKQLASIGIGAVLCDRPGVVEKRTPLSALPVYVPELLRGE